MNQTEEELFEEKQTLVMKIVGSEWEVFGEVQGIGGPAPCQQDEKTFTIMRSSQFFTWPNHLIRSYMLDFQNAYYSKRNLLAEKYGHMMQYTDLENYKLIQGKLPKIPTEQLEIIEKIVKIQLTQMIELEKIYPKFVGSGRNLHATDDHPEDASYETYLRGELSSYSLKTVKFYHEWLLDNEKEGINTAKCFMLNVAKQYGYPDLESAEQSLA